MSEREREKERERTEEDKKVTNLEPIIVPSVLRHKPIYRSSDKEIV